MKLIRCGPPGLETPGIELPDGTRLDASSLTSDFDESFLGDGGIAALESWARSRRPDSPLLDPHARLGPPIARPSKIVCIGLNFRDHAEESGMALPSEPVIFFKSTTALAGPEDDVVIPPGATKLDWEVELAVVIGQKSARVTPETAAHHIAGYVLHNDYSERAFQLERGGQWVKGKSADTFAPMGPFLATPDEIPDPQQLNMWLTVNGAVRQKGTTANMIFDVRTLVSYVSQFMTLLPGDVISTGTPAGVGMGMKPEPRYLAPGDVVELGIDGLGRARQQIVAFQAREAPAASPSGRMEAGRSPAREGEASGGAAPRASKKADGALSRETQT
jgi:2-keto-4-pentenoate hydratase/2-oxohepta-3-ene-1,7-dioic acid hydratase in catechol pathway